MKKQELLDAINRIELDSAAQERIIDAVIKNGKGNNKMSKKKIFIIAAAATMVLSIGAYAASGIISSWAGSSNSWPDYKELPTAAECMKDIGYEPVLTDGFENGYVFKTGNIVNNSLMDEHDNAVEKFKSISFDYVKDDDMVIYSAMKYDSEMDNTADAIAEKNGTEFYYSKYTNKAVPADYTMTDEDKRAEENGELVFSYGANEVSISEVQGLSWYYDGIHYSFTQIDGDLSADELVAMAEELVR